MTEFIEKFNNRIKNRNFEIRFEEKLYDFYILDEIQNKYWLIQKFFEYIKSDLDIKYYILVFIKFLGEKNNFDNNDVVNCLEYIIQNYFENAKGEFNFIIYSLETLVCIGKNDYKFFKEIFKKYLDKIGKNIRLLAVFLEVFSVLKINDYCFDVIVLILKNSEKSFYKFDVWEYFNKLDDKKFRKYILKLFKIFTPKNEKEHLTDLGRYVGLINFSNKSSKYLEYELDNKKLIDEFLLKIKIILTSNNDLRIIRNFLFSDLDIISFRYQDIAKNYFDIKLFLILQEKDSDTLYQYLKQSNLSNVSFSNPEFIFNQLNSENIGKIIELYSQNVNFFFRIYLLIKEKNKKLLSILKKNKKLYDNLILIEKESLDEQKKWNLEEEKRWNEWKKGILYMTDIDDGYYPKLLQDYYNMINDGDGINRFSNTEKQKLKKNVKKQALWCLNSININNYIDERIKNIVTFEVKGEGSYSITPFVHYLYRILNISKNLKFDVSKYYKEFILLFPLVFGDESQNLFLDFLKLKKLTQEDVDYILKAYNEDLHENAHELRFFNPSGLCKFYKKFKSSFSAKQKDKLKNILLESIKSDKIRYKDDFIELYSELVYKEEFINIYHEPSINYFKSIISNEIPVSEEDKIEFSKQLKINELLITKFNDKDAVLWRIKQIREGVVKFNNPYTLKNGEFVGIVHAISSLENELEFILDDDRKFYHFVTIKNTVDIKDEMLGLLELGLGIDWEIKLGNRESDFKSYSNYLINIFYQYVKNLSRKKRYYNQTMKIIGKYEDNNLNISLLIKYFGLNINDNILFKHDEYCYKYKKKIIFLENQNKNYILENIRLKDDNYKLKYTLGLADPKCIIFVEGLTDKTIIETAYNKIYGDNNDFIIRSAGGARELSELMKGLCGDKTEFKSIITIGLFDFDSEGYLEFNRLGESFHIEKKEGFTGLFKKNTNNKKYSMTLPIPGDKKDLASTYIGRKSMLSIENLFHSQVFETFFSANTDLSVKGEKDKWISFHLIGNDKIRSTEDQGQKIQFSKFISTLNRDDFLEFKPLFNLIKDIINGNI